MTNARKLFSITGSDARHFLQGLVTNDVDGIDSGLVYAALLTPQGKYLADFFLSRMPDGVLLDVAEGIADPLVMRLGMYKLRADVAIAPSDLHLHRGTGTPPSDAMVDPRNPDLGWRAYRAEAPQEDNTDWDAIRVANLVPESGIELTPESYILECGFQALNGVDFRKGCYVGQEVTARMKHKTELRKGLVRVAVSGEVSPGTPILREGKTVGTVFTQSGGKAIAYLRNDRAGDGMTAGDVPVSLLP